MRHTRPDSTETEDGSSLEQQLRREVEELRQKLYEHQLLLDERTGKHAALKPGRTSSTTISAVALLVLVIGAIAFFAGYLPRQRRDETVAAEVSTQEQALPRVMIATVAPTQGGNQLVLPGNIQPVTEAPLLARSTGYIKNRFVDIGDRVKAGQLLAEIEAPELDQQVEQAQAALKQAQAAFDQTTANYDQGKANLDLARVTAQRYGNLAARGVVSRQDNDQYQAAYQSQQAQLSSLEKAIAAAKSAVASSEANLGRLREMQAYKQVKAPFEGVITVRNIDVGALINAGNTLLFRIAQINTLRTYVNVPQADADSVKVGQIAKLTVSNLPGRTFIGRVARTASSLDPATRTLLVEIQVPNTAGDLLPGMYADVDLNIPVFDPPMAIPADALVVRSDGTQVAIVRPDQTVHYQKIEISRDFGDHLELRGGLRAGDQVILHPNDSIREGVKVQTLQAPAAVKE
jgi:RND family efflux transporter MFP subunit